MPAILIESTLTRTYHRHPLTCNFPMALGWIAHTHHASQHRRRRSSLSNFSARREFSHAFPSVPTRRCSLRASHNATPVRAGPDGARSRLGYCCYCCSPPREFGSPSAFVVVVAADLGQWRHPCDVRFRVCFVSSLCTIHTSCTYRNNRVLQIENKRCIIFLIIIFLRTIGDVPTYILPTYTFGVKQNVQQDSTCPKPIGIVWALNN